MNYLDFLTAIHKKAKAGLYFEIGCRTGESLAVSMAKENIGVDPSFMIKMPLKRPTRLFKMKSDNFFAKRAPAVLGSRKIDIAFIDGMHLAEFAYRDFLNVEKYMNPNGIVIFDDIMPEDISFASRSRNTVNWTGDVYKVHTALKRWRPDLQIDVVKIDVKGAMVIRKLDPESTVLSDHLAEIEEDFPKIDDPVVTIEQLHAEMQPIEPELILESIGKIERLPKAT